jgi:hypothetical protein
MDNLAFLALGFLLGVICTLKVTLSITENARRRKPQVDHELRVAADGEVLEDFV